MTLPKKIFFTGAPGSYWSGIAQIIEQVPGIDTSDHSEERQYVRPGFTGHKGAYFGDGMEFPSTLNDINLNAPWNYSDSTHIIKSHEWAEQYLNTIKTLYKSDWVMLVYRPTDRCLAWWFEAGGFNITYPNYSSYKNVEGMRHRIELANSNMLEFAYKYNAQWNYFTEQWIEEHFGVRVPVTKNYTDVLVTVVK